MMFLVVLSFSLVLSSLFPARPGAEERSPHTASTVCEALLAPMREVQTTLRQGHPLTTDQEAVWRTWNQRCRHASWQQALAEGLPAPRTDYPPNPLAPPPPGLTWRDYALAAVKGFERGATTPITSCRTTYARRGTRAGSYTTCTTY